MLIHIVKSGDTIYAIAGRYGVSAERIMSDNGISDPRKLVVGQALLILLPAVVYTVRRGDTLASIAARHGVTEMELLQNNPELTKDPVLRPGRQLTIRFTGPKRRTMSFGGYIYPYVNHAVLRYALPFMTTLTIFGYGFREDGTLIPPPQDDQPIIDMALRYLAAPVLLLSSITESDTFDTAKAGRLFRDEELQKKVLDEILAVMLAKGYRGLDIDFEYIDPADEAGFLNFITLAGETLHPHGFFINTDLAPKTSAEQRGLLYEAHDYQEVGARSDTVMLMTYEYGYVYGPPMAVAPLPEITQVVEYAVTEIPPSKILLGIPNYGYAWRLPFKQGVTAAQSLGNQYAVTVAARYGAEIQYDEKDAAPYFEYFANGAKNIVWFEDVRSIQKKLELVENNQLLGAAYWNLMRPFNQNFGFISANYAVQKIV